MAVPRYAIYFVPAADTPLGAFGLSILGYDSRSGRSMEQRLGAGDGSIDWLAATRAPRLYGFHATLKAPFRLKHGSEEPEVRAALSSLARGRDAVVVGPLEVTSIGAYVVLRPRSGERGLTALAQACVEQFEAFRAPMSEEERRRRHPELLTARQRDLLETYGYPFVAEEFRFHMTLAGPLASDQQAVARIALAATFASLEACSVAVEDLALMKQDAPDAAFRVIASEHLAPA